MNRRNAMAALTGAAAVPLVAAKAAAQATPDTAAYVTQTLQDGGFALAISQLARKASKNPAILTFAGFEIIEQTAVGKALANSNIAPPFVPTPAQAAMLARLEASSGATFDYNYVSMQYTGHLQLLSIQNTLLTLDSDPTNDVRHIALLARSNIEQHLTILRDLLLLARLFPVAL